MDTWRWCLGHCCRSTPSIYDTMTTVYPQIWSFRNKILEEALIGLQTLSTFTGFGIGGISIRWCPRFFQRISARWRWRCFPVHCLLLLLGDYYLKNNRSVRKEEARSLYFVSAWPYRRRSRAPSKKVETSRTLANSKSYGSDEDHHAMILQMRNL